MLFAVCCLLYKYPAVVLQYKKTARHEQQLRQCKHAGPGVAPPQVKERLQRLTANEHIQQRSPQCRLRKAGLLTGPVAMF
jgi:hypothetical protein